MAISLDVDKATCIKCGKCVKTCPVDIFVQKNKTADIEFQNKDFCISCGHCVAICPTDSVLHSVFPPQKVHKIDRSAVPSPEQMMLLCKIRRSNRLLTQKAIPMEILNQVLEAAHRAPTSSNSQLVEFTLVVDPDKLHKVIELTVDTFQGMLKKLTNPFLKPIVKMAMPDLLRYIPVVQKMKSDFDEGKDPILRGGTALLLIHTPKKDMFGCANSNLAYQNASLMAESLGLSQIYTGYVCIAIKEDKKKRIAKELGIDGVIHAGMALGIPESKFTNYIDREDIKVNII